MKSMHAALLSREPWCHFHTALLPYRSGGMRAVFGAWKLRSSRARRRTRRCIAAITSCCRRTIIGDGRRRPRRLQRHDLVAVPLQERTMDLVEVDPE